MKVEAFEHPVSLISPLVLGLVLFLELLVPCLPLDKVTACGIVPWGALNLWRSMFHLNT